MIGQFKFWHVYRCRVYFFSARFLNMHKPRTKFYLLCRAGSPGLAFYGSGPARLLSWLGMVNAGSVPCDKKFPCKWNLSFFKAVPQNRLLFHLASLLNIISSSFSHFCLFQNAILHKMLRLGFWNFKPTFLRMQLSFVVTFFFFWFWLFELIFASKTVPWVFNIYII